MIYSKIMDFFPLQLLIFFFIFFSYTFFYYH